MATAYTHDILGSSFNDFALKCARAFGYKDYVEKEPGTPIPADFTVDTYYLDEIKDLRQELALVKNLNLESCEAQAQVEHDEAEGHRLGTLADRKELRETYDSMLQQIDAWNPPADFLCLKKFMREQVEVSLEHDCTELEYLNTPTALLTGAEWKKQRIESLEHDIDLNQTRHNEEVEAVEARDKWFKGLRNVFEGKTV